MYMGVHSSWLCPWMGNLVDCTCILLPYLGGFIRSGTGCTIIPSPPTLWLEWRGQLEVRKLYQFVQWGHVVGFCHDIFKEDGSLYGPEDWQLPNVKLADPDGVGQQRRFGFSWLMMCRVFVSGHSCWVSHNSTYTAWPKGTRNCSCVRQAKLGDHLTFQVLEFVDSVCAGEARISKW